MGSYTKEELQALNMTALKALPEAEGGRSLNKTPLIEYILTDAWVTTQAEEEAAARAEAGPQEGDAGTVTFALVQGERRLVVLMIEGERQEVEFQGGTYTTDDQAVADALYKAGYNPASETEDERPPLPDLSADES